MKLKHLLAFTWLGAVSGLGAEVAHPAQAQPADKPAAIVALKLRHTRPETMLLWLEHLAPGGAPKAPAHALTVPPGIESLVPSTNTNEIWVRGTQDGIAELRSLVDYLDKPRAQVEILTQIVELDPTDAALLVREPAGARSVPADAAQRTAADAMVAIARPDFQVQLMPLITSRRATMLNSTRVTTPNNTTVKVSLSENTATPALEWEATPTVNTDASITIRLKVLAGGQQANVVAAPTAQDCLAVRLHHPAGWTQGQHVIIAFVTSKVIAE